MLSWSLCCFSVAWPCDSLLAWLCVQYESTAWPVLPRAAPHGVPLPLPRRPPAAQRSWRRCAARAARTARARPPARAPRSHSRWPAAAPAALSWSTLAGCERGRGHPGAGVVKRKGEAPSSAGSPPSAAAAMARWRRLTRLLLPRPGVGAARPRGWGRHRAGRRASQSGGKHRTAPSTPAGSSGCRHRRARSRGCH